MQDSLATPDPDSQIQQSVMGNQNQTVGQVLGGIVIYVSGGQAIINPPISDVASMGISSPSKIGSNPYKGLLAFQETDGERFFGRGAQINELWKKFRGLYEDETATRLLAIYGPSGSGKSSLARAGLISELARHPLPGRDHASVAVLVPSEHPIESLAIVLARIATKDLSPVAKTREFTKELNKTNSEGFYDGLRRIADTLPEIDISPLIVLVDQMEEVFTLCEEPTEREAFISNLLDAVTKRSKRVSVIITLRSDFLGATQRYPLLNQLISQGFFVCAMNAGGLREAITQPALRAGHPLDLGTVNRLIEQTEGRDGALPLLQFALSRIWKGLAEGKEPTETLKAINGVGGSLAVEAQRIYESLNAEKQAIARRVFLRLVQLGEGTKDTRRRIEMKRLASHQDKNLEQVQKVIARFAEPGARLITLAGDAKKMTVEVTHEALFEHWEQLEVWLKDDRKDLLFQRRLEAAAIVWDEENNRSKGNLWRSPDLDSLRDYHKRSADNMTSLQLEFFNASDNAVKKETNDRRRLRQTITGIVSTGFILLAGLIVFSQNNIYLSKENRRLYEKYAYCPIEKGRLGEKVGVDTCFRNLITSGDANVFFSSSNFHLNKGIENFKKEKFESAEFLFKQAIDGDRSDPVAQIFLNNAKARLHGKSLKLAVVTSVDYYETAAKEVLRGVADAQDEFNQRQEKNKYSLMEIVIVNDDNEPEAATKVAKELVDNPDILGIIGHHSSESTASAVMIYKNTKIAVVSSTSSSSKLSDKQFFRTVGSTKTAAKKYVKYIRDVLKLDKIFILFNQNSAYSNQLKDDIKAIFPNSGASRFNDDNIADMSLNGFKIEKAIERIRNDNKAALVLPDVRTNSIAIAIIRKNATLSPNQKLQLFGAISLTEEDTIRRGGAAMEGLTLAIPCLLPKSKYMKHAARRWLQQEISWRTATSYDAVQVFAKAIELSKKNETREEILRQIQSREFSLDVQETSGFGLKWDHSKHSDRSNVNRRYCIAQIKKNRFVEIPETLINTPFKKIR
jgi:ABC-type branched-subunit amino acid transport system substrate-binding protein